MPEIRHIPAYASQVVEVVRADNCSRGFFSGSGHAQDLVGYAVSFLFVAVSSRLTASFVWRTAGVELWGEIRLKSQHACSGAMGFD